MAQLPTSVTRISFTIMAQALSATSSSRVKAVPRSYDVFSRVGMPPTQHLDLLGNIAAPTGVVDKSAFIVEAVRELVAATVRRNH